MEVHAVFDDGESQAGSAYLAAAAFVNAVEAFKDAVHVLFRYTGAIVREAEIVELRVLLVAVDRDMDTFARIRDRMS